MTKIQIYYDYRKRPYMYRPKGGDRIDVSEILEPVRRYVVEHVIQKNKSGYLVNAKESYDISVQARFFGVPRY